MVTGSLPRRYARAVMGLESSGNLEAIAGDLRTLAKAMKDSAELLSVLASPVIRRGERRKVIDALMQLIKPQPHTQSLVHLLLDRERLGVLPDISREVDAMLEARSGRMSVELITAKPLSSGQVAQVTEALAKLSGKRVDVSKREDPDLLGGIVAKLGDRVYDGSLRTQLRRLRAELTK